MICGVCIGSISGRCRSMSGRCRVKVGSVSGQRGSGGARIETITAVAIELISAIHFGKTPEKSSFRSIPVTFLLASILHLS